MLFAENRARKACKTKTAVLYEPPQSSLKKVAIDLSQSRDQFQTVKDTSLFCLKARSHKWIFLHEMLQKTQDTSATFIHVRLACVYKELWKSSTLKWKNAFCMNGQAPYKVVL